MDHSHDHAPAAANPGFAPDHQPMAKITIAVVAFGLFIIGLGFALAQLLGIWAQEQMDAVQGNTVDGRLTATRAAAQEVLTHAPATDPETQAHSIPVADAMRLLAASPELIATKALWPDLPAQDDPNAVEAPPAGGAK